MLKILESQQYSLNGLKSLCYELENFLINEVACGASELEVFELDPCDLELQLPPEAATSQILLEEEEKSPTQLGRESWVQLSDNKTTLRKMAEKLGSLSEELSSYKAKQKKEVPEVETAIRSMGKISARMDSIITTIQAAEKEKEFLTEENDRLTRMIQQLELEERNLQEEFQQSTDQLKQDFSKK